MGKLDYVNSAYNGCTYLRRSMSKKSGIVKTSPQANTLFSYFNKNASVKVSLEELLDLCTKNFPNTDRRGDTSVQQEAGR